MKKFALNVVVLCLISYVASAQVIDRKEIDGGSSGPYKAIAAKEATLPSYVVYRPKDLKAACRAEGKLPVLVFGNGGCSDTSITHERVLSEIASHGYIVIAIGALQKEQERKPSSTESSMLIDAMDWIEAQSRDNKSDYYQQVDIEKIAAGGQSCGGAQTMYASADPRVKTSVMFNSGMGDMRMAGADKESLKALHAPIIYIIGGESDIAYPNAEMDYERITHLPVVVANHDSGHMGTFGEEYGGTFAKIALAWLDWQFKDLDNASLFLKKDLNGFSGWLIKSKNFK